MLNSRDLHKRTILPEKAGEDGKEEGNMGGEMGWGKKGWEKTKSWY